jgi:pimeloyl-ACP methyl ester carboxylesterase
MLTIGHQKPVLKKFSVFAVEMLLPTAIMIVVLFYGRHYNAAIDYGNNPKAGNYATVNGIKMYYETYGIGKPLLFIHGNGGSINSGKDQILFFSKNYKVIAADSRGQGKTIDTGDSLTYNQIADDINALLNKLKIDSAYIIGFSDGGIVGLILAIKYAAKVKMLTAVAPNTRPDSAVLYPEFMTKLTNKMTNLTDLVKQGYKDMVPKLKLTRLLVNYPHISNAELSLIKAPVLLISGDRDMVMLSHISEIFRAIPKSQLCVLPGSNHFAIKQNSKVFNETIDLFFSRPFAMPNSF